MNDFLQRKISSGFIPADDVEPLRLSGFSAEDAACPWLVAAAGICNIGSIPHVGTDLCRLAILKPAVQAARSFTHPRAM